MPASLAPPNRRATVGDSRRRPAAARAEGTVRNSARRRVPNRNRTNTGNYTASVASTRNNRAQDRRTALREQHRREKEAADTAFTLLDKEDRAREASADGVANLVDVVGKARATELLGLTPAEVTAYLTLHREMTGPDDAAPDDGDTAAVGDPTAEDGAASIPAQSEAGAAAAEPATA